MFNYQKRFKRSSLDEELRWFESEIKEFNISESKKFKVSYEAYLKSPEENEYRFIESSPLSQRPDLSEIQKTIINYSYAVKKEARNNQNEKTTAIREIQALALVYSGEYLKN